MATLAVTKLTTAGILDALAAAAGGGDAFANDGKTWFEINNGGGGPITVTFTEQAKVDGETITPRAVVITNATRQKIGPFPTSTWNDANGLVQVTYSGVTTVTVGAFRI